ncbi:MAG: hypothetical protein NW201_10980 [Gemmatimonadales bacterium]|nr:hypothetical protein [Gemmatimonadales bacterium]
MASDIPAGSLAEVRGRLAQAAVDGGKYSMMLGVGGGLAALGAILAGLNLTGENAERVWHLIHVNWIYFTGLTFGSLALSAVHKVVNAKWSGVILRFAQANVLFLPVVWVFFLLLMTVGYEPVWGHMHEELHTLPHGKEVWLSHPVMFGRLFLSLALMSWFGWKIVRTDIAADAFLSKGKVDAGRRAKWEALAGDYDHSAAAQEALTGRQIISGCLYVVVYALGMTCIAFDGMMSLQPHWFSNLFGGWYFMGSFLGAHMLLNLMQMYGGNTLGISDLITGKQRHDLGKLCFGFTIFWTYLMWAQFQVIWYANLPEETGFVFARLYGDWLPVGQAVFLGMFVIPFFGFLGVEPKKTRPWAMLVATISLTALFTERYLMIVPTVSKGAAPQFGLPEIGPTALFLGLFLVMHALFARTYPIVSPRLAEITLKREIHHFAEEHYDATDEDEDYFHAPGTAKA